MFPLHLLLLLGFYVIVGFFLFLYAEIVLEMKALAPAPAYVSCSSYIFKHYLCTISLV